MTNIIKLYIQSATAKTFNKENELSMTSFYMHNSEFPTFEGTHSELRQYALDTLKLSEEELKEKMFIEVQGFEFDNEEDSHWTITSGEQLIYKNEEYYKALAHNLNPMEKNNQVHAENPMDEIKSFGWLVNDVDTAHVLREVGKYFTNSADQIRTGPHTKTEALRFLELTTVDMINRTIRRIENNER